MPLIDSLLLILQIFRIYLLPIRSLPVALLTADVLFDFIGLTDPTENLFGLFFQADLLYCRITLLPQSLFVS